jgi:hypothetical protein
MTARKIPSQKLSNHLAARSSHQQQIKTTRSILASQLSQKKNEGKSGKINGANYAKYGGKLVRKIARQIQRQIGQIHTQKHDTAQIQSRHKMQKYAEK